MNVNNFPPPGISQVAETESEKELRLRLESEKRGMAKNTLDELRLMNARIEKAFESTITHEDIEKERRL